jgi:hypothetical protein
MTIRGGGHPILDMASVPRFRMGPPPWSFAADAYDCIMVQLATELTGYKFVARCSRLYGELPSDGLDANRPLVTERQIRPTARATRET